MTEGEKGWVEEEEEEEEEAILLYHISIKFCSYTLGINLMSLSYFCTPCVQVTLHTRYLWAGVLTFSPVLF